MKSQMKHPQLFFLAVCWVICVNTNLLAQNDQQTFRSNRGGQVLVLKNGNVLRGAIERTATHFQIHTPQGNRLVVPFNDAEFLVENLEQAYWKRLSTLRAADYEGQELLFYWCLKYELAEPARNQLEILQSIGMPEQQLNSLKKRLERTIAEKNPASSGPPLQSITASTLSNSSMMNRPLPLADRNDPLGPSLDEAFFQNLDPVVTPLPAIEFAFDRSKLTMIEPELHQPLALSQPIKPSNHPLTPFLKEEGGGEESEFAIRQVSYDRLESRVSSQAGQFRDPFATASASASNPNRGESIVRSPLPGTELSSNELTVFIKSLPVGSFQAFRQRLERHLVLQCGDCHRRTSPDLKIMPLMFTGKHQPINARMSQRNIHSVMSQIHFEQPDQSPILLAAKTAHGGTLQPSFREDSQEYQTLKTWVQLMAQEWKSGSSTRSEFTETEEPQTTQPLSSPHERPYKGAQGTVDSKPGSLLQPLTAPTSSGQNPPAISKPNRLAPPPGEIPRLNASDGSFKPKDEFDPEIFNRFHFQKQTR
jgi:hypothetical protein